MIDCVSKLRTRMDVAEAKYLDKLGFGILI